MNDQYAFGFGLPIIFRGPIAGMPTILPDASLIGVPAAVRMLPLASRTYVVPKKCPGASPESTRIMLKLSGMKNAPPVLTFVTFGLLVAYVPLMFQVTVEPRRTNILRSPSIP